MDLIEFTHIVTRAGSAFGFAVMAITAMVIARGGHSLAAVKQRAVWLPWLITFLTMVLASAVTGGLISDISAGFTGTGNKAGADIGHSAIGQDGAGAATVSVTQVLGYSGSWLVLVLIVGVALFIWFAKGWRQRALALSGALTGSTWGITSAIGGWAAMALVPLFSWLGELVIG